MERHSYRNGITWPGICYYCSKGEFDLIHKQGNEMKDERFVIVRDVHSSKELAKNFQPARAYTYEAAIARAKECAGMYPGVSFLVYEIKGKAGIQEVVYSEL